MQNYSHTYTHLEIKDEQDLCFCPPSKSKWKSEKETVNVKTDLETDTKLCLEKRELKKKHQTKPNRMKQGKEVFTVELLKPLKINMANSEKSIHQE